MNKIGMSIAGLITGVVVCLGLMAGCSNIDATTGATPELTGTITDNVDYKTFDGHNYSILNDNGSITVTINDWDEFSTCKMIGNYSYMDYGIHDKADGTHEKYTHDYWVDVDIDVQKVKDEAKVWVTTETELEDPTLGTSTKYNPYKRDIVGIVNEDTNTMAFSFYIGDSALGNIDMIFGHWNEFNEGE